MEWKGKVMKLKKKQNKGEKKMKICNWEIDSGKGHNGLKYKKTFIEKCLKRTETCIKGCIKSSRVGKD